MSGYIFHPDGHLILCMRKSTINLRTLVQLVQETRQWFSRFRILKRQSESARAAPEWGRLILASRTLEPMSPIIAESRKVLID